MTAGGSAEFHIAQVNVARLREPLDHPSTQAFVAALEPINALADRSPGFVWRLQTDEGDATSLRVFDDEMIIVNMSVWESMEALRAFVFRLRPRAWGVGACHGDDVVAEGFERRSRTIDGGMRLIT